MGNIKDNSDVNCSSCGICSVRCPKQAISMDNIDGFYKPVINAELCVDCGICKKSCVKYNAVDKLVSPLLVVSAKASDNELLDRSSSGGIVSGLLSQAIDNGMNVYGCEFNVDENIAIHTLAVNKEELKRFNGSKYMQSNFNTNLDSVLNCSSAVVVGTPCQIFALHKLLVARGDRENYLLIDFYCHGTPTKLLWDSYRDGIESKKGAVQSVEFRSKEFGWHNFGNKIVCSKGIYAKKNDLFFDLFFTDKILNESCYNCDCRASYDYVDIRVGDFWGNKYDGDNEGVSAVCICTSHGQRAFDEIKNDYNISVHELCDVEKFQSTGGNNEVDKHCQSEMLELLRSRDAKGAYKAYLRSLSFIGRVKTKLKRIFRKLPLWMTRGIKRIYHKK